MNASFMGQDRYTIDLSPSAIEVFQQWPRYAQETYGLAITGSRSHFHSTNAGVIRACCDIKECVADHVYTCRVVIAGASKDNGPIQPPIISCATITAILDGRKYHANQQAAKEEKEKKSATDKQQKKAWLRYRTQLDQIASQVFARAHAVVNTLSPSTISLLL
jgi:hypothetical protein